MQQSIFVSAASKLRINRFERGGGWFVLPFFVLFLVFGVFGLLFTLVVSFHRWDPINGTGQLIFRGWRGYYFVLTDQGFWQSLQQSLGRALPEILIQHLLAFPLAFALYLMFRRSLTALGMLIFLPYLAIPVGLTASLSLFYNLAVAPINASLGLLHNIIPVIPNSLVYGSSFDVFFSIWSHLGWNVLLYLMAFASIPRSTLEAAALDGAAFWQQILKIAIPLTRPMIFVAFSMSLVNALQTNTFRPVLRFRRSPTDGLPAYIYKEAFSNFNLDSASVMTWVFYAIVIALIVLVYFAFGRNFTQIEQPAALEENTMPASLSPATKLLIRGLVALTVVCSVLPFLIALSQSTQFQAVREFTPPRLAIEGNTLENYRLLIQALPSYWRNFWNSLYVSTLAAFGAALVSGLAGFSFAVLEFPAKRLLFGVVMCTMVFPAMSTAIPYLIEMRILNWLDTPRALWLPSCVSALGVFLVRQYALNALPKTMIEAARVDGTNNWSLFWRIGLPNLMPVLVTVALLVFVTSWNHLDAAFYVIQSLETRLLTDALGLLTAVQARTSFTPGGQIVSLLNPAILGASLGMLPVFLIYLLSANQLGHGLGISQGSWHPRVSLQSVFLRLQAWFKNLKRP